MFSSTDHDECANSTHQCDHICHNTHGGYNCSCFTGFRLHGLTSCTGKLRIYNFFSRHLYFLTNNLTI